MEKEKQEKQEKEEKEEEKEKGSRGALCDDDVSSMGSPRITTQQQYTTGANTGSSLGHVTAVKLERPCSNGGGMEVTGRDRGFDWLWTAERAEKKIVGRRANSVRDDDLS